MTLAKTIRDNEGATHKAGEHVVLVRRQIRLGVHDIILVCQWANGARVVLLPSDVQEDDTQ